MTVSNPRSATSPKSPQLPMDEALADSFNSPLRSPSGLEGGRANSRSSSHMMESVKRVMEEQAEEEKILTGENAVDLDLSAIRGIEPPEEENIDIGQEVQIGDAVVGIGRSIGKGKMAMASPDKMGAKNSDEEDLEALAELVPSLKTGMIPPETPTGANAGAGAGANPGMMVNEEVAAHLQQAQDHDGDGDGDGSPDAKRLPHLDSMVVNQGLDEDYSQDEPYVNNLAGIGEEEEDDDVSSEDDDDDESEEKTTHELIESYEKSTRQLDGDEGSSSSDSTAGRTHASDKGRNQEEDLNRKQGSSSLPPAGPPGAYSQSNVSRGNPNPYQTGLGSDSDHIPNPVTPPRDKTDEPFPYSTPSPVVMHQSSAASLSTATQSHEVRMPMYLPTFRPATGCTNASDFIVRCFVARLRAGITVVKHGRSRWCKSRLRVLHVHSDGRSLSWRPAQGEPTSNRRPPKLDLSTCLEVRHAWSPDPLNPMFTGTPILRSKCEAANAFKSFALIFPRRTVDITAVTADQCKVLMEGFSALCFRLQVANMASKGRQPGGMVGGSANATGADGDPQSTGPSGPGGAGMNVAGMNTGDPNKIPR